MHLTIDQALLQAVEAHKSGKLQDAEQLYRAILQAQPKHPDANHNLGVLAVGIGKPEPALPFLKTALEANPKQGRFWISYLNALIEAEQFVQATNILSEGKRLGLKGDAVTQLEQKLERLVHEYQSQQEINNLLSNYNAGNFDVAEHLAKALTQKFPNHSFGWKILGAITYQTGRLQDSLASMRQAIRLEPNNAEAHYNLGAVLNDLGRLTEAKSSYREAIRLNPDYAEAHYNLGVMLKDLGRLTEAQVSYREAIRVKPDYAEAHGNLGVTLQDLGRLTEAQASYREALRLNPDYAEAHNNLGVTLQDLGRLTEAQASYREALRLNPDYADAHNNLGYALQDLGRLTEAQASYREAIRLKPDFAEAQWNLSFNLLLQSNFKNGLKLYEMRWDGAKELRGHKRRFSNPIWLGEESLDGKSILIHAEQGLGDTIQFCRYVKMIHDLGAKVIFEVQPPLLSLLADLDGVDQIIPKGQSSSEVDYHCPLLSLPFAFKTDLASIPAPIPYLYVQPERIRQWNEQLGRTEFKIGICWKGANKRRSIPIEYFLGLSQIPQVRLISLHKGDCEKELEDLPAGMKVETLGTDFDSTGAFMDTAAVMRCCDLVITNDTSVAHVAGALGLPTWIALLFIPDWRWLLDRTDSPWYPTVRLFRQHAIGDWRGVFDKMESKLRTELGVLK